MVARLNQEIAASLTASFEVDWRTDRVVYFPIRHHSPACAWHLQKWIRSWKPGAILVEGPASFTPLIPLMLDSRTRTPFAVYTSFAWVNEAGERGEDELGDVVGRQRRAAYYPFCDSSPELVALRVGKEVGARLQFIDLDYARQVVAEQAMERGAAAPRVESLMAERYLKRSLSLQALARRAGCRDHNELWDHLFETRWMGSAAGKEGATETFVRDVAAWCAFARGDAGEEELKLDGTVAREAAMAEAIREEVRRGTQRVLVVTGGFHTVTLPGLVAAGVTAPKIAVKGKVDEPLECLIRYGFESLDALNGYSAGMPSPSYYDQLWQVASKDPSSSVLSQVAASVLVEVGRRTRQSKGSGGLSTADEIAALEQASRLAQLRGHPGPMREDLVDGVRSCLVKGSMEVEGGKVLGWLREVMTGVEVGSVPPESGMPPLVADFHRLAGELRLQTGDSARRELALDLYRKTAHRRVSRLLHALNFLEVPFGVLTGGPDFVTGVGLELLIEHWTYQWTPRSESQLIEAGVLGATIEEAAANRLARHIATLDEQGKGRNASEAVSMLVQACRMGLHRHVGRLLGLISDHAAGDPQLTSLAQALAQLILLYESREPLEAHGLASIPELIRHGYDRACYRVRSLADTPVDAAGETLEALVVLRDLARSEGADKHGLDAGLLLDTLATVLSVVGCPPLLAGGVAGLLYGEGRLEMAELIRGITGYLDATTDLDGGTVEYLAGVLRTARELAWREPALLRAVDGLLNRWNDDEFIERIPRLRMAFAQLTPRETDRVAGVVAGFHGQQTLGSLVHMGFGEAEAVAAARMEGMVRKALEADGLGDWVEASQGEGTVTSTSGGGGE